MGPGSDAPTRIGRDRRRTAERGVTQAFEQQVSDAFHVPGPIEVEQFVPGTAREVGSAVKVQALLLIASAACCLTFVLTLLILRLWTRRHSRAPGVSLLAGMPMLPAAVASLVLQAWWTSFVIWAASTLGLFIAVLCLNAGKRTREETLAEPSE